jgi:hypothetical protein
VLSSYPPAIPSTLNSPSTLVKDDPLSMLCERCLDGELPKAGSGRRKKKTAVVIPLLESVDERKERMTLLARIRMFVDSPKAMAIYRRCW